MVWVLAAVLYIVLFIWLGVATLRNGHGWLFFFGIFFPLLLDLRGPGRPTGDRCRAPVAGALPGTV